MAAAAGSVGADVPNCKQLNKPNAQKVPLDGGWAWVVMLASMVIGTILGGLFRSYGVLYIILLERFRSSSAITAWVGGASNTILLCLGPVSTGLSKRYGAQVVMFIGSLFMAGGCFMSAFAPNIEFMFFSYSLLTGIGSSLVFLPSTVLVGEYFSKYRSLACGIASSGSGIGLLMMAPFINGTFNYYGFTGMFIILGAVMLNLCASALLHRPLENNRLPLVKNTPQQQPMSSDNKSICNDSEMPLRKDCPQDKYDNSDIHINDTQEGLLLTTKEIEKPEINKDQVHTSDLELGAVEIRPGPIKRKPSIKKGFGCCADYEILKNPSFMIFMTAMGFHTIGYKSASILLVALAQSHGHSYSKSIFLLSTIGIADLIGRFTFTFIFVIPGLKKYHRIIFGTMIGIIGLCNFIWSFVISYEGLLITCALFGTFHGVIMGQRAPIVANLFGIEKLNAAFGWTFFASGFGALIGPPIAGLLYDVTGVYTWSYRLMGTSTMIGTVLFFVSSHEHAWPQNSAGQETSKITFVKD